MPPTNSRKSYTAELKLRAVDYAKEHGNRAARRQIQIDESIYASMADVAYSWCGLCNDFSTDSL